MSLVSCPLCGATDTGSSDRDKPRREIHSAIKYNQQAALLMAALEKTPRHVVEALIAAKIHTFEMLAGRGTPELRALTKLPLGDLKQLGGAMKQETERRAFEQTRRDINAEAERKASIAAEMARVRRELRTDLGDPALASFLEEHGLLLEAGPVLVHEKLTSAILRECDIDELVECGFSRRAAQILTEGRRALSLSTPDGRSDGTPASD